MFTRDQHGTRPVNSWLLDAALGTQVSYAANAAAATPSKLKRGLAEAPVRIYRRHLEIDIDAAEGSKLDAVLQNGTVQLVLL